MLSRANLLKIPIPSWILGWVFAAEPTDRLIARSERNALFKIPYTRKVLHLVSRQTPMSYLRVFFLVMLLYMSLSSAFAEGSKTTAEEIQKLRSHCILPDSILAKPPQDISDCGQREYILHNDIWVRRPESRCCVALIRISENGKAVLNPDGFLYGPIPNIAIITRQQADALWQSEPVPTTGPRVSYKLSSFNDNPEDVYIDVVFENNKVDKYRLRAKRITIQEWQSVTR
ncbi:MAG TPA: hypothetical protein PL112_23865 [Candidatus Obscuribacter sp.]|nr:hypothetical protein [Candidatus Obscuribacter sp.]MBK9280539.1 hypothetical protein [Candidatus Obscuribacter sp.]MBL8085187.1 hypothetical protein [Candidatus Obscuribacter sp.]HMX47103.1 hypothetical protein [Candidatus Obscuribacter sp.]HMY53666.1 hypothetical protein [Candidatus Obscuribacter sp.]